MIRKYAITLVTMLTVWSAGVTFANDIYKWIDDQGNVHYVDRPTGAANEERVPISSRPTNPSAVQARVNAQHEARAAAHEEETPAEQQGPTEEELEAQAREREEKCNTYKARLQKFLTSRRLYREDENGERVYLNEEETMAARERAQQKVEEYCGS